jgi:creatinine amidohydrolase
MRLRTFLLPLAFAAIACPAAAQQRAPTPEERAEQERRLQVELRAPRPIDAVETVWIEDLTWMEVRDAVAAGKKTVIISTGGIEQNGPYAVTGKHNIILRGACVSIAKRLGNALCAPVIGFVPEGDIERKTGHMRYPGTISLKEETFRALLDDVASSMAAHGFTEVILIGDSGGNQTGLKATAEALNQRWAGSGTVARFVPEYYQYQDAVKYMNETLGITEPVDEGYHDYYWITALMMAVDPASVRYDQRVKAGKASINGVSIAPKEKTMEVGRKLMEYRTEQTVRAIQAARAAERGSGG